ncbi:hypothetical protein IU470_16205 [Nocardia abscessus]|uniref:Uncharacterized protein n=1 Tax=Nocardia abscessus TaxID=120957 RepID=A0ABS0CAU5_9NOCA|nr:hypothetical protein [Nocardia abscessus]MBF6226638.1 hypothetical protein [Nocardia abscessus]
MAAPRFGEVWHAPSGSVLPGGMLCLIVSSDDYNRIRRQYIIVEVVSDPLSGDAIICELGPVGVALTGAPFTVGPQWFAGADEPVAVVDEEIARRAANQIRAILGP